ncbi:hypothetical protein [Tenuifilum thalassicum]|uniref:Uncharacterized protein n=1 Tax=Tenuifilum thalassicum TaxID=2590900 RepID=A0A7D4BEN3_9BACT|nr:hypothetical protein [Tenuifilum thalassicum]QKG80883.1 hypothetical protein FHG85_11620 [Tenuifilum thalassicum]
MKQLVVMLCLVCCLNSLLAQNTHIIYRDYMYNGKKLFSTTRIIPGSKSKNIHEKITCKKLISLKHEDKTYISCLGSDMSLHFLQLSSDTNLIKTIIELNYGEDASYYPIDVYTFEAEKGSKDIVVKFVEGEGPVYLIKIYRWDFSKNTISDIYTSQFYFSYPSWNPFAKKEEIRIEKGYIVIPYCLGCQSGEDGVLKTDTLFYLLEQKTYSIR